MPLSQDPFNSIVNIHWGGVAYLHVIYGMYPGWVDLGEVYHPSPWPDSAYMETTLGTDVNKPKAELIDYQHHWVNKRTEVAGNPWCYFPFKNTTAWPPDDIDLGDQWYELNASIVDPTTIFWDDRSVGEGLWKIGRTKQSLRLNFTDVVEWIIVRTIKADPDNLYHSIDDVASVKGDWIDLGGSASSLMQLYPTHWISRASVYSGGPLMDGDILAPNVKNFRIDTDIIPKPSDGTKTSLRVIGNDIY